MKRLKLLSISILFIFQACSQTPLEEMTSDLWFEDIDYLHKKIQKEFASFIPGIKAEFSKETEALKKRIPTLENYEVACEIQRLLSLLQDGHTELNIGHNTIGFHRAPLSLYFFGNELRILAAHEEFKQFVGAKVVQIGRLKMHEAFDRVKHNMSRDNDMEYLYAAPGYLILTELLSFLDIGNSREEVTFQLQLTDGKIVNQQFTGLDWNSYQDGQWVTLFQINQIEPPLYLSFHEENYWSQYLEESGIMYFKFSRLNNQKGAPSIKKFIKQLFTEIDKVRPAKFVVDFRHNNGGNYHLSKPLIEAIKSRSWLNEKGKVWAITGRRTFSAASVASIFLKEHTEALLIGEAGRTHPNQSDNNEYMTLPNSGFLIEYTTKVKVHWPEKQGLDHIPVDVNLPPDYQSYSKGIDPVLDYLLKN